MGENNISKGFPRRSIGFAMISVLALIIAVAGSALAGPIPAGWSLTGNGGTLGADGVVTLSPFLSSFYEYVTTSGGIGGAGEIPSVGGTNGSTLSTPVFSANASDKLDFYFNYVTSDGAGFADYAWAQLVDSALNPVALLFTARTQSSGTIAPGVGLPAPVATLVPPSVPIIPGGPIWSPLGDTSGVCSDAGCGYTGWIESQYTIGSAGNYILQFGVTNWIDNAFDSGLAINGVIAGVPIEGQVPEPGTLMLLGTGLAGVVVLRRSRRQDR